MCTRFVEYDSDPVLHKGGDDGWSSRQFVSVHINSDFASWKVYGVVCSKDEGSQENRRKKGASSSLTIMNRDANEASMGAGDTLFRYSDSLGLT